MIAHWIEYDNITSIEWISADARFGLWVEDNEAGWFLVSKKDVELFESGNIDLGMLIRIGETAKRALDSEADEPETLPDPPEASILIRGPRKD